MLTLCFCFPNCLLCLPPRPLPSRLPACLSAYLPACGSHAGVYGDVQRVKILYNKKDSALIQMSDANQAQLGKWIVLSAGAKVASLKVAAAALFMNRV